MQVSYFPSKAGELHLGSDSAKNELEVFELSQVLVGLFG